MKRSISQLVALFGIGLGTGCAGTGPSSDGGVTLLLSTKSIGPAAAGSATVTQGIATIVLTKVELVARQIRLRRATDSCDEAASSEGTGECGTLRLDPALLDLPLSDGVEQVFEVAVPAGTYDRLQFHSTSRPPHPTMPLFCRRIPASRGSASGSRYLQWDGVHLHHGFDGRRDRRARPAAGRDRRGRRQADPSLRRPGLVHERRGADRSGSAGRLAAAAVAGGAEHSGQFPGLPRRR